MKKNKLNIFNCCFLFVLFFLSSSIYSQSVNLIFPENNTVTEDSSVVFSWDPIDQANISYNVQISEVSSFSSLLFDTLNVYGNRFSKTLNSGHTYFWRIRYFNSVFSNWSNTYKISVFSPKQITGLAIWLRADKGITNISGKVTNWADQSSNLIDASQTTTLNQPDYNQNAINGYPTLSFSDDYLSASLLNIGERSEFIVAKRNGYSSATYHTLIMHNNSPYYILYVQNADSIFNSFIGSVGFDHAAIFSKDFQTITRKISQTQISLYKNGLLSNIAITSAPIANSDLLIGGYQTNKPLNGSISEIIIYDHELHDTLRTKIESYLQNKYAPKVNLGANIISYSYCPIILKPNAKYKSYLWSTNEITDSIIVSNSGKYYLSAIDYYGNTTTDTISVNIINQLPHFFSDTIICPNQQISWNTNLPKNVYTFQWQDNSNDSLFIINTVGQFFVTVTDSFGCSINSNTVTVTQDAFPLIVSFGPDTNLCSGNAIYLKQGLSSNLTYTWNTGSNNDSLYISNSGQYSAIITNSNNCVAKDTINVTVIGQAPTAAFLNSVACKNNVITFTDNSSPPSGNTITSWFWNYGDGTTLADTSHLQNPFYTYSDTGNYTVNLNVSTNVGCKQSIIKNIHVAPKPTVNYNNIIACKNDSALFSNLSSSLNYTPLTYSWHFGDPSSGSANSSTLANPKHLFSQQSIYPVKLITTNKAGCSDSITKNINVKAQVTANFTNNSPCTNAPIIFQDNSIEPAPINPNSHFWTIGTSTLTGLTATKSFTIPGVYPVALTVNGSNGCISSITKQIDVKLPPFAELSLNTICLNDTSKPLNLSVPQNGPITSWNWQSNTITFSTSQTASLVPTTPGNYNIKLVVTSSDNCKDSMTKQLTVLALPNVDFVTNPNSFYYINSPITFSPTILTGSLYNWAIDGNLYATPITSVSFNTVGTHTASLYMKDAFGCANKKTKSFNVYGYFSDLAVIDIRSQKSNDNFISVEADLANFGTTLISNFEISYQITDAGTVKEIWNGTLNPSAFMTYQFNSKAYQKNNSDDFITCINIGTVNSIQDDNLSNNNLCIAANVNNVTVNDPSPNPTDGDINLSVVLPKSNAIIISLVDALGQVVYPEYTINGSAGLNLLSIPTTGLNRGPYVLKITIGDKIFNKKILKTIHD